ncbi:GTPase domain-containing protein [Gordonia alkaliphila]|uniref:G domain-containing protein n=1 Tax=Gordonia alkaliphila TaxID=1053547 RepID=A0ABP8ZA67_9ACTN
MNDLLFHAAPAAVSRLSQRLTALLDQLPSDERSKFLGLLVIDEHERPRMVFTGQYSSGKSTLIRALTNEAAEVVIDSAVATDQVQVFDWDGLVDLVDTPGVQAGLSDHDRLAEDALRSADLVLFAVTVDLFDDGSVEHLRHITEDLRKAPQLVVVITKSRTLHAAAGVREAAVRAALGTFADQVPWVECDAKTYLDGLHENDQLRASRRLEASGMAEVTDAINRIARERGELARFCVPLQQIALAAGEASAALADDPDEQAILTVLARQRRALTNRRGLLESALEREASEFRSACIHAVETLADAAESIEESENPDWSKLDAASDALNTKLSVANQRFTDGVHTVVSSQLADFTSEVREIEASPYAHQLRELEVQGVVEVQAIPADTGMVHDTGRKQRRRPTWGPKAAEHLKGFQKAWGAGDGLKQAAGSSGHQIVYKVGKLAGWNFEPWQAVRWANNIGKFAKAGAFVLPVALEAYAVVSDEREEVRVAKEKLRRRNALVGRVLARCDDIAWSTLTQVRMELDAEFDAAVREIDNVNASVRANQTLRSDLTRDLGAIQSEAIEMLDRLGETS